MHTVYETLEMLGAGDKTVITVFNKIDKVEDKTETVKDCKADVTVRISAKKKIGLEELVQQIEKILREQKIYVERVFSYNEAGKIQLIRKYGQLLEEEYKETGIFVRAYLPKELYYQIGEQ